MQDKLIVSTMSQPNCDSSFGPFFKGTLERLRLQIKSLLCRIFINYETYEHFLTAPSALTLLAPLEWPSWQTFSRGLLQDLYLRIRPCRSFAEVWAQRRHTLNKSWQWQNHVAQTWCCHLERQWINMQQLDAECKTIEDQCNHDGPTKDYLAMMAGWRAGVEWPDGPEKPLDGVSIDSDLSQKVLLTRRPESSWWCDTCGRWIFMS